MPLTVTQFWQQEQLVYQRQLTAAQSDLSAAQLALAGANAALTVDVASFSQLGVQIQAARAALADSEVPVDVSALNLQIRDLIIAQHGAQGALLDDKDDIDEAQNDLDAATVRLARASTRATDAGAKLATAQADEARRQAIHALLLLPPFDTLSTDASDLLASATKTNADAAIAANIPAELVTIAGLRAARRAEMLTDARDGVEAAEDALAADLAADDGLAGAAAKAGIAFRQADRTVRDYAASASARVGRARAVLTALEALHLDPTTAPPLLSDAAHTALIDVGALAARQTAESHAVGIDTARATVANALRGVDAHLLTAIDVDVDAVETDADLVAARAALEAAQVSLAGDETTFAAGDKVTLDDWQVLVPDSAWRVLLDYTTALADLAELKAVTLLPATDPNSLLKKLNDAEGVYGDALAAAGQGRRRADALADQVAIRQHRLDAAASAYSARALSAVRGDSY